MTLATLLFATVIGFNHAFEADHVLAVGNLANKRKSFLAALRDGLFWGLGHTSTILAVGCIIIIGKLALNMATFELFEVGVGLALIFLGFLRLRKVGKDRVELSEESLSKGSKMAYSIGLIHGLAGSGAVVLIAMSEIESSSLSLVYMLLFGAGSILGMMLVAMLFKLPVSTKAGMSVKLQRYFILLSGLLCIGYGIYMIFRYFQG